jgi:hypothetical protein
MPLIPVTCSLSRRVLQRARLSSCAPCTHSRGVAALHHSSPLPAQSDRVPTRAGRPPRLRSSPPSHPSTLPLLPVVGAHWHCWCPPRQVRRSGTFRTLSSTTLGPWDQFPSRIASHPKSRACLQDLDSLPLPLPLPLPQPLPLAFSHLLPVTNRTPHEPRHTPKRQSAFLFFSIDISLFLLSVNRIVSSPSPTSTLPLLGV